MVNCVSTVLGQFVCLVNPTEGALHLSSDVLIMSWWLQYLEFPEFIWLVGFGHLLFSLVWVLLSPDP